MSSLSLRFTEEVSTQLTGISAGLGAVSLAVLVLGPNLHDLTKSAAPGVYEYAKRRGVLRGSLLVLTVSTLGYLLSVLLGLIRLIVCAQWLVQIQYLVCVLSVLGTILALAFLIPQFVARE